MPETLHIRVPATVANLGPGFDCLGLAVTLHNELEVRPSDQDYTVAIHGEGSASLPTDASNLIVRSMLSAFERAGRPPRPVHIVCRNSIPLASGLGSSSSAIVGGLLAANALVGNALSREDMVELAASIEGHPDNVAPALYGGLVVLPAETGAARCLPFVSPHLERLRIALAIPQFEVATHAARAVLPDTVPRADAVFNVSRVATLLTALHSGDLQALRWGTEDRLHQPYRSHLIPGGEEARQAALDAGALGAFVSGSGPTIAALCENDAQPILDAMITAFRHAGHEARGEAVALEPHGAHILAI